MTITVERVETLSCESGWRNYYFCKITASDGTVGWSEFDEGFGSPGVATIIEKLGRRLVGKPVGAHERAYADSFSVLRPAIGSVISQAMGAIENALLDTKAKILNIPCYELLGGKLRDAIPVYWSHSASWRISHPHVYGDAITDIEGVRDAGARAKQQGYKALKTNLFLYKDGKPVQFRPGFGVPFTPELNVTPSMIRDFRMHLDAITDGAGPDVEVLVDLNFNFKTEGYVRVLNAIADMNLFWVEIDSYSPEALAYIRSRSNHPIASGETLLGLREFLPYFQAQAMDVAIVDTVWNGIWQSLKIAAAAEAFEVNVATHNFYGHLCTMMNAHFASAVPNLRVMELDVERPPLDKELYTAEPVVENGTLIVPDRPGWGIDPIEEVIRSRPPRGNNGIYQVIGAKF